MLLTKSSLRLLVVLCTILSLEATPFPGQQADAHPSTLQAARHAKADNFPTVMEEGGSNDAEEDEDYDDDEGGKDGDTDSVSLKNRILHKHQRPKATQSSYPPNDSMRFSRPLSAKAAKIYSRVMEVAKEHYQNTPTPPDLIGTSGRLFGQLATYGHTDEFCQRMLFPMIVQARKEVLISTFIFDKDTPTSSEVTRAIVQLNKVAAREGRKVRVWILIDPLGALFFNHELPPLKSLRKVVTEVDPKHYKFPDPKDLPNLDLRVKTYHKRTIGVLHTKMILIDGKYSILGSKNMDGDSCMEYMYAVEGAVTGSMRADFQDMWRENLPSVDTLITRPRVGDVPMLVLGRVEGRHITSKSEHNPQDEGWLSALDEAESEIYIQTPNFVEKRIAKKVLETVRRGIKVTIVEAYSNQDFSEKLYPSSVSDNRGTAKWMYKKLSEDPAARARLRVCWFIGNRVEGPDPKPSKTEWSHVKAMVIDREMAFVGSGNQDPQSWYNSRENNVLIDDRDTAMAMYNELTSKQRSLQHCYGPDYKPGDDE